MIMNALIVLVGVFLLFAGVLLFQEVRGVQAAQGSDGRRKSLVEHITFVRRPIREEKPEPAAEPASAQEASSEATVIEVFEPDTTVDCFTIFVGDSRTVQMKKAVEYDSDKVAFVAESGMGYDWFEQNGLWQANSLIRGGGTNIVINMGVNDVGDVQKYAKLVNRHVDDWVTRGCNVFYMSVNPVSDSFPTLSNSQIANFNDTLQELLSPDVYWIDTYHFLMDTGFSAGDGLHYSNGTYEKLYAAVMETIAPLD
ncbi:MAG: hypothetical protein J6I56_00505 [Lachnospiraceae bacterium]|nr:hypothetical protein [Lachnospiraceae bacterium]